MNHCKPVFAGVAVLLCMLALSPARSASDTEGQEPIEPLVNVNGESVTLDDLRLQLDQLHWSMGSRSEATVHRPDPWAMLERMVNVRLIVQEAKAIGILEMPDVVQTLEDMELELLKQQLVRLRIRDITTPDPDEVDRLYRAVIREVAVESALFRSKEYAEEFTRGVGSGQDFLTLARKMFDEDKAVDVVSDSPYFKKDGLLPAVSSALAEAKVGSVSQPIGVGDSFAVVKLVDEQFPDDPEARQDAYDTVLRVTQQTELMEYMDEMRDQYADIDRELAESLNFQKDGPGIASLKGDTRIVAEIEGGKAITVAELSERVEKEFYHGIETAIDRNRVNAEVLGTLDRIILERATILESEALDIENTRNYRTARKDQESRLLFSLFNQKVVNPEIKIDEPALEAFYQRHASEYVTPVYVRIDSLAFESAPQAEAALKMLREGADLKWMRENADGLADPDEIVFGGGLLAIPDLPDAVRSAVASASEGELLLYAEDEGHHHVLLIAELYPGRQLKLEEIREQIEERLALQMQQESVDQWINDLRDASEIEYLVDKKQLRALLGLSSGEGA